MTVTAWVLVGLLYKYSESRVGIQPPLFADEVSCLEWKRQHLRSELAATGEIRSKAECIRLNVIVGGK